LNYVVVELFDYSEPEDSRKGFSGKTGNDISEAEPQVGIPSEDAGNEIRTHQVASPEIEKATDVVAVS